MITLEQVDQLRKRTNCSYEEAKELLEKHDGNVLEAIVDFERSKNTKYNYNSSSYNRKEKQKDFWLSVKQLIQKGFENRVVIENENGVLVNIPVNIMILIVIFVAYIAIPLFIILLFLGYKISIRKPQGDGVDISSMMNDIKHKFTSQNHAPQKEDMAAPNNQEQNNDYNELTIE
ncbi:MAG: DUF4342 domain-containing protein [Clostridiaceae bacterium]|jgi:hypothetical protein|nr:DUF4342 domain-containing protein [Clostridiaceae bacterium]